MNLEKEILRLRSQGLSREKISRQLGITEYQVRKALGKLPEHPKRILKIKGDELLTPDEILERAHLDPLKFVLVSYNQSSYRDGSIRIQVKPRSQGLNWDEVLEKIKRLEPERIQPLSMPQNRLMVELGLTDMHWGINTYEDYRETLQSILAVIKGCTKILLIIGSDSIHVNGFSNKTINDTQLEEVNLEQAYEDAFLFYSQIIRAGLEQGSEVAVIYIPANHDRDISWALSKTLEVKFPEASHLNDLYPYKAIRWGSVALGWTHGDKGKPADYDRLFISEFPSIFSEATNMEIHSGHLHREGVTDTYGVMLRCLPTGTKRNKWTAEGGLISVPRFQAFIYDQTELRSIAYV